MKSIFDARRARAFTLIEMLAAIAVIVVLASSLLPVLGNLKRDANRAQGTSNLRQVGAAIIAFAGENNARLPGPAPLGIYPDYSRADATNARALGASLAPYMGLPDASTLKPKESVSIPGLVCPGFKSVKGDPSAAPNWVQNAALSDEPGKAGKVRVFGALEAGTAEAKLPLTMFQVANLGGPSKVWALTNLDQDLPSTLTQGSGWLPRVPADPVYKKVRLRLFLDGHVEAVALDAPVP